MLQNSLEQTVLAVSAHLVLATVLRGEEMILLPVLVPLYLVGRGFFALGYAQGAAAPAFGMALTGASTIAAFGIAVVCCMISIILKLFKINGPAAVLILGTISVICLWIMKIMFTGAAQELREKKLREQQSA